MTPNTVSTLSPAALAVLRYLAVNELERCGCIEPRRVRLTEYGRSLAEMRMEM